MKANTLISEKGSAVFYLLIIIIVLVVSGGLVTYFNSKQPSTYELNFPSSEIENTEKGYNDIVYFQKHIRFDYEIELLKLALDKTVDEYGPYNLIPHELDMTEGRGLLLLEQNKGVDVAFIPTTFEREEKFLPVRIPINRGMLGYRVFLANKEKTDALGEVNSLQELSNNFTAGFGSQWADLEILETNGVKVSSSEEYETIINQLNNGTVDYFPRGIGEAWVEYDKYSNELNNIAVEENIALYYPYVRYFFVNKNNEALANRIEAGLKIAESDGSFRKLFNDHFQENVKKANLGNRKMFVLTNPTMPNIIIDTAWWLAE